MLEAFDYLAQRDSIKEAVNKKAEFVLNFWINELEKAKFEFDRGLKPNQSQSLNIPIYHGKYSGHAIWLRSLIFRIDK